MTSPEKVDEREIFHSNVPFRMIIKSIQSHYYDLQDVNEEKLAKNGVKGSFNVAGLAHSAFAQY